MAIDALLKKYFAGVVLGLVALAAYFQASGATQLMGSAFTADPSALAATPTQEGSGRSGGADGSTSAEPLLSRNPFDSVTGPLNAQPIEAPEVADQEADLSDPLGAPGCDGVSVRIVTESTDPMWSLAALQVPGESKPKLARIGDEFGDQQVAYIGFNWRENSPAVWMTSGSALCQALLFSDEEASSGKRRRAKPKASKKKKKKRKRKRRKKGRGRKVPDEIANKIKKVSDTEYHVDRSVVDKIMENQAELMRSARIVPEQKNGEVVGIRMFGIRSETLLGTLGFKNGDRLETINGFNMSSPEKALEAYARLRTASNLNVKINRRGKPMSIDFQIK